MYDVFVGKTGLGEIPEDFDAVDFLGYGEQGLSGTTFRIRRSPRILVGIEVVVLLGADEGQMRFLKPRNNEKWFFRGVSPADGGDCFIGNLSVSKRIVRQVGVLPREKPVVHSPPPASAVFVFGKQVVRSLLGKMPLGELGISGAVMHFPQCPGIVAEVGKVLGNGFVLLAKDPIKPWRVGVIDAG